MSTRPPPDLRRNAAALRSRLPPAPTRQEPPKENGKRLATIPRPGRNGAPDEEIRVNWSSFEGKPFLQIRVWVRQGNDWWPVKEKGLSVRVRELADFADGIAAALEEAERAAGERR
jgi:hypothetical protein